MMPTLSEIRESVAAKRKQLHEIFAEAGPDRDFTKITSIAGDTKAKVEAVQQRNAELNDLVDELKMLEEMDALAKANDAEHERMSAAVRTIPHSNGSPASTHAEAGQQVQKSLADHFMESIAFSGYQKSMKASPAAEVKIDGGPFGTKTVLTETGFAPQAVRIPRIVETALQAPRVADLIPSGTTDQIAIVYMEETTATNAAAGVTEGNAKPESALAFTERSTAVRKIATVLPITDELMNDIPAMRSYTEARLRLFLAIAEDSALLVGNGTPPNITGLLNISGIQTQAKGTDPVPDAIYKAMIKIETAAYLPASGVIMHPLDWQDVALLRTADGIYIWGAPMDMGPKRIWGLPVVTTTAITQNTGLVGAFDSCTQLFRRAEVTFAISTEHSDFFIRNQLMLRVEERLALVVYRPNGLCTATGI